MSSNGQIEYFINNPEAMDNYIKNQSSITVTKKATVKKDVEYTEIDVTKKIKNMLHCVKIEHDETKQTDLFVSKDFFGNYSVKINGVVFLKETLEELLKLIKSYCKIKKTYSDFFINYTPVLYSLKSISEKLISEKLIFRVNGVRFYANEINEAFSTIKKYSRVVNFLKKRGYNLKGAEPKLKIIFQELSDNWTISNDMVQIQTNSLENINQIIKNVKKLQKKFDTHKININNNIQLTVKELFFDVELQKHLFAENYKAAIKKRFNKCDYE